MANSYIPQSWFKAFGRETTMIFLRPTASRRAEGDRKVGWLVLPPFQRGAVWTPEQKVRFIESCWLGLPIGVFIYNEAPDTPYEHWLLDGQQRVTAVIEYMGDAFPVFGRKYSELGVGDHRVWDLQVKFGCLVTNLDDEAKLREVYDRLAYGGTPHEPKDARSDATQEDSRHDG